MDGWMDILHCRHSRSSLDLESNKSNSRKMSVGVSSSQKQNVKLNKSHNRIGSLFVNVNVLRIRDKMSSSSCHNKPLYLITVNVTTLIIQFQSSWSYKYIHLIDWGKHLREREKPDWKSLHYITGMSHFQRMSLT